MRPVWRGRRVLNAGASDDALFVEAAGGTNAASGVQTPSRERAEEEARLGFGDRDCLAAFAKLPEEMRSAGRRLVEHIRRLNPAGDLNSEGKRFVNRPDNFVTLEVQPRVREILVTFKGSVKTSLKPASARRPYQGFKVAGPSDVLEAMRVIGAAKRRS